MKDADCRSLGNLTTKSLLIFLSTSVISIKPCLAQSSITPDNTLGTEASVVTPNGSNPAGIESELIEGGAQRGQNLFHSFQEFNISEGRAAYFLVPNQTIQNVLTRVTGTNRSQIFGTLGTTSNRNYAPTNANLVLINPNGIVFGRDASLDVNGSFIGTTANAVEFGERGLFSATSPQAPSELLTVAPSAFLFNQINAQAAIQNNSVAEVGLNPSSEFTAIGLRVPDSKSLLLVGGDINMDGGGLVAFGGRVELGGLASAGTIGLNQDNNNLSLSFPDGVARSDVDLSNGAGVIVTASDGGSIAVNARNLELTTGSFLNAGIESGLGSDNSQAGDIEINAMGAVNLSNESLINNSVPPETSGQGGDISISASSLRLEGGAEVGADTSGAGKGGSLTVNADDVQLLGTSADTSFPSGLFTSADENSTGDAGDLTLITQTLLVRDGARVSATTFGTGRGGSLTVNADDVQLLGTTDGQFAGGLFASADENSTGDAGDLTIQTNTLLLRDGAQVGAGTFSAGKGGNLIVNADDVQLLGTTDGQFAGSLFASAQANSTGDAGNLTLNTQTLLVRDGAQIGTGTFGTGKGGSLTVNADDVQLIGESTSSQSSSGLFTSADKNSTGDAGDLTLNTQTLLVRDGAQVGAGTFGAGKGGSLTINANDVQLIGRSANTPFRGGLFVDAQPDSTGDAGNLTITTSQLQVLDGARISARTLGEGKGGNLTVDTDSLQLSNGGIITAISEGTGTAGNITLNIENNFNASGGQVLTQAEQSSGGDITITTGENIFLRNNSDIKTILSTTTGSGGNITLTANTIIALEDSDILTFAPEGSGGNIIFDTPAFFSDPLFRPTSPTADRATLAALDGNNRVDVNASGRISAGTISGIADISLFQNSLLELSENPIDTAALVASSCVVRSNERNGTFFVMGKAGLPYRPGDAVASIYSAVDVQPVADHTSAKPTRRWKKGDPIVEPSGVYSLEDGQRLLSRECGK